jgi:hypothetical protein
MSIGIASVCDGGKYIAFVTDQMVSAPTTTIDHAVVKADFIGPTCLALWAGDDITSVPPIIRQANGHIPTDAKTYHEMVDVSFVAQALATAYEHERRERARATVLSVYDLDVPRFLAKGKSLFGESDFSLLQQKLEQVQLGVTFLVCGFIQSDIALFTVGDGGVLHFNKPGWWAIGSGDHQAISSIAFRGHNTTKPLAEALYTLCEAKFRAEAATGVGRTTSVGVLSRETMGPLLVSNDHVAQVREAWEREGKPPIPADALTALREWIALPTRRAASHASEAP